MFHRTKTYSEKFSFNEVHTSLIQKCNIINVQCYLTWKSNVFATSSQCSITFQHPPTDDERKNDFHGPSK